MEDRSGRKRGEDAKKTLLQGKGNEEGDITKREWGEY